ncbi:MAG: NUDIX hydrolase [Acidobacteria bacterium]|nr:NUDIX hydrolase [Acidobacteriota bacterium]
MSEPIVPHRSHTAFTGRIFTVRIESITLPRGHTLDAEIVSHPGSVVLIPVTDRGDIVLVRQYRHAIGRSVWELPAGSLKPGEQPRAAAVRECHEEIGLIPTNVVQLGAFFPTPGYCNEKMTFFRMAGLRQPTDADPQAMQDEDEDIEARAFPVDVIRQMIASGEMADMKTVAALALIT